MTGVMTACNAMVSRARFTFTTYQNANSSPIRLTDSPDKESTVLAAGPFERPQRPTEATTWLAMDRSRGCVYYGKRMGRHKKEEEERRP